MKEIDTFKNFTQFLEKVAPKIEGPICRWKEYQFNDALASTDQVDARNQWGHTFPTEEFYQDKDNVNFRVDVLCNFSEFEFSLNKIACLSHKKIKHLVIKPKIERIFDGVNVSSCA